MTSVKPMQSPVKVAVAGLPRLAATGVRYLLGEYLGCRADVFDSFGELAALAAQYDAFVVDCGMFVSHSDFFMPRKTRVAVCMRTVAGGGNVAALGYDATDAEAVAVLRGVIELDAEERPHDGSRLSAREIEVMRELAKGKTNKEIADALFISVNTVISHRKNISAKLGIRSASGLSIYAMMNGLL